MIFKQLAECFQRLERTSSRLEMTRILAELFKEASDKEIAPICYLSLGRLTPLYESLEFQLAEKMVMRAIARAFGEDIASVQRRFKVKGDLGEVAEEFKIPRKASPWGRQNSKFPVKLRHEAGKVQDVSTLGVYTKLRVIAEDKGEKSQERKVAGLVELLRGLDSLSVRYLTRMVVGKLRLGFSDKTIIDALSWMIKGDKSLRGELEQAYFVRADIGELARQVKSEKLKIKNLVGSIVPKLGVPVMPTLCQRLKTAKEMLDKMGNVVVEPKFDGTRCISGNTGLLVRKRGFISVREVKVGDEVLTHKGRFRRITNKTFRWRRRGERVFRFQSFLGSEFRVSGDHKFLVVEKDRLRWVPIEAIGESWVYFPRPEVRGKEVARERSFVDKAGYKKTVTLNEDFFKLLGCWIGDGISNNSHQSERVGLVFNKNHIRRRRSYEKTITDLLHITELSRENRQGAVVVYWRDPVFRRWLCEHFRGENESGKRIPDWFFGLDKKRFMAFMEGWKEADGTARKDGNRIVTKERQLALMALILGFKHGLPLGIRKIRIKLGVSKTKTYYELIIPGTNRYVKRFHNGYLVKVRRLERNKVTGRLRLYDIQVKDDESFCTSVASLHNCQIHIKGKDFLKTFTRNMEESTGMFPELKRAHAQVAAENVILDSEAVGVDPKTGKFLSFQDTMVRKRKHKVAEMSLKVPLKFFVFDVLFKDGESLLPQPLAKRRKILENLLKVKSDGPPSREASARFAKAPARRARQGLLQLTEQVEVKGPEELLAYHGKQLKQGLEGAVVKKADSPYVPGRRAWNWVKFKEIETARGGLADTLDCVVMGYYGGRGKRAGFGIGAFLVGVAADRNTRSTKEILRLPGSPHLAGRAQDDKAGLKSLLALSSTERKFEEGKIYTIAKIGTGLSDEQWREMKRRADKEKIKVMPKEYVVDKSLLPDVWVAPGIVVEIAADNLTRSPNHSAKLALRFPRLVRFRDDKRVEQATSVIEIKRLYDLQSK